MKESSEHLLALVNSLLDFYRLDINKVDVDIVAIWADPSYANNELGWRAERSLDETLAAARCV